MHNQNCYTLSKMLTQLQLLQQKHTIPFKAYFINKIYWISTMCQALHRYTNKTVSSRKVSILMKRQIGKLQYDVLKNVVTSVYEYSKAKEGIRRPALSQGRL